MTNPNPQPVSEADLDALVERAPAAAELLRRTGNGDMGEWVDQSATAITSLRNQLTASEARERELREVERFITLWRKTGDQCLDWDFHISEFPSDLRHVLANLKKQGVRQHSTYRLGKKVEAIADLTNTENHHHDR